MLGQCQVENKNLPPQMLSKWNNAKDRKKDSGRKPMLVDEVAYSVRSRIIYGPLIYRGRPIVRPHTHTERETCSVEDFGPQTMLLPEQC